MHEDGSSSANANGERIASQACVVLLVQKRTCSGVNMANIQCCIQQTSPGVFRVTREKSAFFLRKAYLNQLDEKHLQQTLHTSSSCKDGAQAIECTEEEYADILQASLAYAAEQMAMAYLARAEQCRAGLFRKLLHKGLEKAAVTQALDYLESCGYLDDERFAGAWLRTRAIHNAEGKTKLSAELAARGIPHDTATRALESFFSTVNEQDLCQKALRKLRRQKKSEEQLFLLLRQKGFSSATIKQVFQEES